MTIGLDIGSSSIKALWIEGGGRAAAVRRPITTRRGPGSRVEHDADAILLETTEALRQADKRGGAAERLLGIATQRSTVLFWDRDTGRPLTPAYSWQDRRGAALCARLRRGAAGGRSGRPGGRELERFIAARTGLRLTPYYSAAKLAWALAHVPGLRRRVAAGRALWGTLGTFLVWRLSGGAFYAIDHANAQRTLLLDHTTLFWDPDLFHLFGLDVLLDAPVLPAAVPTCLMARPELGEDGGLPGGGGGRRRGAARWRCAALTGDQQAALLGLGCRAPGDIAINYGSGAFLLKNVGAEPVGARGLLATLVASWQDRAGSPRPAARYAVEGTVNAAATAIDWAAARLRMRLRTSDLDRFLERGARPGPRVFFLPAVSGLGAPRWDETARPRFAGDLARATPRDLVRAVVESIACRCAEIARAAGVGPGPGPVLVSGGLVRCRTLLQAQADLLGRPLLVLATPDATARGAALLARDGPRTLIAPRAERGRGSDHGAGTVVQPRMSRDEAEDRYRAWERAVYRPGRGAAAAGWPRRGRIARS
jgi:glycerol kinase